MSGDCFVYGLMLMNAGAAIFYAWDGLYVKAAYWIFVMGINYCVLRFQ